MATRVVGKILAPVGTSEMQEGGVSLNQGGTDTKKAEKLKGQTLGQLATTQRFATRLSAMTRIERDGTHTLSAVFAGEGGGQHVALITQPFRIPVVMQNAGEQAKMRSRKANDGTQVGEWVTCNVMLDYDRTLDRGQRPRNIASDAYRQYEILFNVASVSCKFGAR